MSRPMRLEYPGAVYHITSRGNAKGLIFLEDSDKIIFLEELSNVIKRYNWLCHSYCLMSNHYHLLIETLEANLAVGMQHLNSVYSMLFNKKHHRVGHLFQGRYKSIIVDRENYLLELCRYIVLNPVRANIVDKPEDYPWSSYCATSRSRGCPDFLTVDWILKYFENQPVLARKKYSEFVYAGIGGASPWNNLHGQIILGTEKFISFIKQIIGEKTDILEIPRAQRLLLKPQALEQVSLMKDTLNTQQRNRVMYELHYKNGFAINKIARLFSLSQGHTGRIIKSQS